MSLHQLVAHYLATNYPSVAQAFCAAAGIAPPDLTHPPNPDLQTVVQDYLSSSVANNLARVEIEDDEHGDGGPPATDGSWRGWKAKDIVKVPLHGSLSGVERSIQGISASNLLTVGYALIPTRAFDTSTATYRAGYKPTVITSSVDKNVYFIDYATGKVDSIITPHRAAVLSFAVHPTNPRYILTGSMDGTTVLTDLITRSAVQTFKSSKFVVRVAFSLNGTYFATASYDRSIVVYQATTPALASQPHHDLDSDLLDDTDDANLACDPTLHYEQVHRVPVDSNPEALLFTEKYLIYTLRSSPLLHYLFLGAEWQQQTKSLNPHHMDNHQSFAVLHLALHPSGKVFAAQTGDHRGGAGERVLIYGVEPQDTERLACLWTGGEVDDYVLPRMAWLPDGSGLITTTPNGYLNLVSLSGEVRSSVKIHGDGSGSSIVRDCVVVPTHSGTDWQVVSVGYDRQVRFSR